MKHYVKLTRYMSGDSLKKQLDEIVAEGLFDIDLRVFFSKSNMLTTEDIAYMLKFFDVYIDVDLDLKNIAFMPTMDAIRQYENNCLIF
jgi:hypothetical protein